MSPSGRPWSFPCSGAGTSLPPSSASTRRAGHSPTPISTASTSPPSTSPSPSTPLDLEDVIQVILRTLRQVVNYEAAAIYLLDPQSQALRMVKEVGYPSGS